MKKLNDFNSSKKNKLSNSNIIDSLNKPSNLASIKSQIKYNNSRTSPQPKRLKENSTNKLLDVKGKFKNDKPYKPIDNKNKSSNILNSLNTLLTNNSHPLHATINPINTNTGVNLLNSQKVEDGLGKDKPHKAGILRNSLKDDKQEPTQKENQRDSKKFTILDVPSTPQSLQSNILKSKKKLKRNKLVQKLNKLTSNLQKALLLMIMNK